MEHLIRQTRQMMSILYLFWSILTFSHLQNDVESSPSKTKGGMPTISSSPMKSSPMKNPGVKSSPLKSGGMAGGMATGGGSPSKNGRMGASAGAKMPKLVEQPLHLPEDTVGECLFLYFHIF